MGRIVESLRIGVTVCALFLAGLACSPSLGGPTPPGPPIPVSTEAAGQLIELWQKAFENAQNGQVSVVMNEEQVTSYVALKLAEDPDSPIRDVQIYLRDDKLTLYGQATAGRITAPAQIVLGAATTADGQVAIALESADFGPVPVPQALLSEVSSGLNQLITGQLGVQTTGFNVTSIAIADGQMAVAGTVTP